MNYVLTDQMEFWSVPGPNIVQRAEFNLDELVNPLSNRSPPPLLAFDSDIFPTNLIKLFCALERISIFNIHRWVFSNSCSVVYCLWAVGNFLLYSLHDVNDFTVALLCEWVSLRSVRFQIPCLDGAYSDASLLELIIFQYHPTSHQFRREIPSSHKPLKRFQCPSPSLCASTESE